MKHASRDASSPPSIANLDPDRRMIAGLVARANVAIDAGADEPPRKRGAQQQMVDAQPGVTRERVAPVFPERKDTLVRIEAAHGIDPPLIEKRLIRRSRLGTEQRVVAPALGRIDVQVGRYDVEIARENRATLLGEELLGMRHQSFEPTQLVVEARPRSRVAVRQVKAADDDVADHGFDIAAVQILRVAG